MASIKFSAINKEKLTGLLNLDIKQISRKLNKGKKAGKLKKEKKFNKKVISLDIGSENIKLVVGRYNNNKLYVDSLVLIPVPDEAVADGKINNPLAIHNLIEEALEANEVKIKECICTTNSTSIINREIIIPTVEPEEEETLVKFEIQRYLPLNMDDYVVQHSILESFVVENQKKSKALVVTYPEKIANSYYKFLLNLKLKPVSLDVTFNSLGKLINYAEEINEKEYSVEDNVAFIDMGANSLNVNIYKNGVLDFTRIIRSGGSNIDVELSRAMGITFQEAERKKREDCDLYIGYDIEDTVNYVTRSIVEDWSMELERIIQFYKNKNLGNTIEKIFIYGGSSNLKGIENYFYDKFMVPVKRIETINNIEINNKLVGQSIEYYLNALGAIIRL